MAMIPKLVRIKLPKAEWDALVIQVYDRDEWKCRICNSRRNLTPDHIIKRSQGGDDNLANLWTLCAYCHRRKDERSLTPRETSLIPIGSKRGSPCEFRIHR